MPAMETIYSLVGVISIVVILRFAYDHIARWVRNEGPRNEDWYIDCGTCENAECEKWKAVLRQQAIEETERAEREANYV